MGFKNEIKARVMVKATEVMGLVRDETTREWVPTKFKGLINTDTWILLPMLPAYIKNAFLSCVRLTLKKPKTMLKRTRYNGH